MKFANNLSIKTHMCSKFGQSVLFTLETIFDLLGMLDSGERSLPFGRLVLYLLPTGMSNLLSQGDGVHSVRGRGGIFLGDVLGSEK